MSNILSAAADFAARFLEGVAGASSAGVSVGASAAGAPSLTDLQALVTALKAIDVARLEAAMSDPASAGKDIAEVIGAVVATFVIPDPIERAVVVAAFDWIIGNMQSPAATGGLPIAYGRRGGVGES